MRSINSLLSGVMFSASAIALQAQMIPTPAQHFKGPNEGKRPVGWMVQAEPASMGIKDTVRLVNMAPGWHMTSGPAALLWNPKDVVHGVFVATALLYLGPPRTGDLPGYGMFFGGRNMGTPAASYFEFLVRNDRRYSLRKHDGAKVTVLKDWSDLAGIGQHQGQHDHIVRNVFRIVADANMVQLMVNRMVALALPRKDLPPDGTFGMRIGASQEMTVDELGIEGHMPKLKMGPVPGPELQPIRSNQRRGPQ
ncbi:MAG: hypothetical protein M3Y64_07420 [Gemmatimonadota bacterium]|nr:hypothetical protein [Gemmatimonadota bacterium]